MNIILILAILLWSFTYEAKAFERGSVALIIETGEIGEVLGNRDSRGQIGLSFRNLAKQTLSSRSYPTELLAGEVDFIKAQFDIGRLGEREVQIEKGDWIIGTDKMLYKVAATFENEALALIPTQNEWSLNPKHDYDPSHSLPQNVNLVSADLSFVEAVEIGGCSHFCTGDYLKPFESSDEGIPRHSFESLLLFSNDFTLIRYKAGKGQGVMLGSPQEFYTVDSLYYLPVM